MACAGVSLPLDAGRRGTYGQHEPGHERGGGECKEDERDDGGRVDWVPRASEHSRIRSGRGRTSADGVDVEELDDECEGRGDDVLGLAECQRSRTHKHEGAVQGSRSWSYRSM
jgi:hypothetical protein